MRTFHAVLATSLLVLGAQTAQAGLFQTDFYSNPYFAGFETWCERFHNASWHPYDHEMKLVGSNTCAPEPSPLIGHPCCAEACVAGNDCSNAVCGASSSLMLTTPAYEPNTTGLSRVGVIDFNFPAHLPLEVGAHLALFSVAHPNCHAGIQAALWSVEVDGETQYELSIVPTDDAFFLHPECGTTSSPESLRTDPFSLTLSSTVRYQLQLWSAPDPNDPSTILSDAFLIDKDTSATIASVTSWPSDKAPWYNAHAKRYGIGALLPSGSTPIEIDYFVSFSS